MKGKSMDLAKKKAFNAKMGKRQNFAKGGYIKPIVKDGRQYFLNGGGAATGALSGAATGAAVGSVVPGIGTAIGAVGGALIGGIAGSGIFDSSNQMPNIVDPVTGQQITDANGNVVANQQVVDNFNATLQGLNGPNNQAQVLAQLQGIANGTGPNPAQTMLNTSTGQNVANTAALQASQRGAASNVGLIARQAGQQGATTQQAAVGQGATLQANQSLNALNSMGGIAGQEVAETQAGLAQGQNAALTNQGQVLGAETNYNTTLAGGQANVNTTNSGIQTTTQNNLVPAATGALGGLGAAAAANSTPKMPSSTNPDSSNFIGPVQTEAKGGEIASGPHGHVAHFLMAKGGPVPAMVSPGERYLNPREVKEVVEQGADPLKLGTKVPGKAKVKGDSLKNDVVKATLEDGGVVLPRHVMAKKNRDHAELFVRRAVHMKAPKGSK